MPEFFRGVFLFLQPRMIPLSTKHFAGPSIRLRAGRERVGRDGLHGRHGGSPNTPRESKKKERSIVFLFLIAAG